jgi:TIR domain
MATLTLLEKRELEKFLQMGGGYVLGFSNRTFQEVVLESTGLGIDDEQIGGVGSKANRLRHFWNTQPDNVVGTLVGTLIDYVEEDSPLKAKCRTIATRLLSGHKQVNSADELSIWGGSGGYRVFLSHKAAVKVETSALKDKLEVCGISAFVAHADIEPTKEWQQEIENALASMHAFVALMTPDFHDSKWTDQEVGYALARGVPIIAAKMGLDPYGFIGKFQALPCSWDDAPVSILKHLVKQPTMLDAYLRAVSRCTSYDNGNLLSKILKNIKSLSDVQVQSLISSFNNNIQLQGSFGFNGTWTSSFGHGIGDHLSRLTGKKYEISKSGKTSTLQVALVD